MSTTHEERILLALVARLQTLLPANGYTTDAGERVVVDPFDRHGDFDRHDRVAILPGDVIGETNNRDRHLVQWPITVRLYTQREFEFDHEPTAAEVALLPRMAGTRAWRDLMRALFPGDASDAYDDDLGGQCKALRYAGHAIYPRDDGEKTTAVFVDLDVQYYLHTNDPDK